jgi:uncharacterized protein (TIGR00266 family)
MQSVIKGGPAFAYIQMELAPGERLIAESDAMASMDADVELVAKPNGGWLGAPIRRFLGGESFFVSEFSNGTQRPRRLTLVQKTPGDIRRIDLNGNAICLQRGAFICATPGVKIGVRYAGIGAFIAREGLFKLIASGSGSLWYGSYGSLIERRIEGEYIVDSSHLVAWEPQMKLKVQMAGGLISSLTSGEGLVTRVEGRGNIILQSRSMSGLVGWLNPKLR